MKIAFWSPSAEGGGATENLAAISAFCALRHHKKVILCSNHFSNYTLQDYFFKDFAQSRKEAIPYCYVYGEPEYFRHLWNMETKHQYARLTTEGGICILPPPDIIEDAMFYEEVLPDTLYCMDIAGKMSTSAICALEEADMVVACLPQDAREIQNFFQKYSSLIPKTVFLLYHYSFRETYTPGYIKKLYEVELERISVIPCCNEYSMACEEGRTEEFIRENLTLNKKNPNYEFIRNVKKASDMILSFMKEDKVEEKKKEKEEYEQ